MISEFLIIVEAIIAVIFILILFKKFNKIGLISYNCIAVIIANIQVLHIAKMSFTDLPMPLGTVIFSSTFLASDILSTNYDKQTALRAAFLAFIIQTIFILFIFMASIYEPFNAEEPSVVAILYNKLSFVFIASIIAFFIGHIINISCFAIIKKLTKNKHLWLRSNISGFIASLADNTIFSILVFKIMSLLDTKEVVFIIIFNTLLRSIINLFSTPILYISTKLKIK